MLWVLAHLLREPFGLLLHPKAVRFACRAFLGVGRLRCRGRLRFGDLVRVRLRGVEFEREDLPSFLQRLLLLGNRGLPTVPRLLVEAVRLLLPEVLLLDRRDSRLVLRVDGREAVSVFLLQQFVLLRVGRDRDL